MGQGAACTSPASIHSVSGSKQPHPWAATEITFLIILVTLSNSSGLLNLLSAAKNYPGALPKCFLVLWQKPANASMSEHLAADPLRRWKGQGSSSCGEFGGAEMSRSPSPSSKHSSLPSLHTSGLPRSLYSMPWACGDAARGVWHHRAPHPWHLHIHPAALSLGILPALSAFAVEVL